MKTCPQCGAQLADETLFCTECGASTRQAAPQAEAGAACPACGAQNPQGTKYCINCGIPLEEEAERPVSAGATRTRERKKPDNKKMVTIAAGVGAAAVLMLGILIVAVVGWSFLSGSKSYVVLESSLLTVSTDDGVLLLYGDKAYTDIYDGYSKNDSLTSMDGSVQVDFTYHYSESTYSYSYALFLLSENGAVEIEEDVYPCGISDDGSTVLYVELDGESVGGELVLYNVARAKKTTICRADQCVGVLSPNGKRVLYCEVEDDEYTLYVYDGSKSTELDDGFYPISISDNGKCIYAYSIDNDALYSFDTSGEREKISACTSSRMYLNSDHTEILFYNDGTYISVNGGEKTKVSSSSLYPVSSRELSEIVAICQCNSSLADQIYRYGNSLYYLDSSYSAEKIAGDISTYAYSDDYSTIYYVKNGNLYRALAKDSYEAEKIEASDDVESIYISGDGSRVYYCTSDDDLYYLKNASTAERVSSDVDTVAGFYNGKLYFRMDGDTFCYADKASRTKENTDTYRIYITAKAVYYLTNDGDLYGAENGTKFTRLARDV